MAEFLRAGECVGVIVHRTSGKRVLMEKLFKCVAGLFLALSCVAFVYQNTEAPDNCFGTYVATSAILAPTICDDGSCAGTCAQDMLLVSVVMVNGQPVERWDAWCECDGANAKVLDGAKCHALVTYSRIGFGWQYVSHRCEGPCPPTDAEEEDTCSDVLPNPGPLDAGKKLCDCVQEAGS
jgi:hypothetical protein